MTKIKNFNNFSINENYGDSIDGINDNLKTKSICVKDSDLDEFFKLLKEIYWVKIPDNLISDVKSGERLRYKNNLNTYFITIGSILYWLPLPEINDQKIDVYYFKK